MINFDEVFERIKAATGTRTQVELAEVLDIRQSSISDAKRRNSVPSDWYMKLFEQFGLNPDWLKKGSGPMYLRTEQGYTPVDAPAMGAVMEDPGKYNGADSKSAVVNVHSTYAGQEQAGQQGAMVGRLSLPQSFATPGIHVVRIDTANMEPYILKGAFVGIDTTQRRVASGELYGVQLPYEGIVLKRTFVDAQSGSLILKSANPAHPEFTVPLERHEEHIIGRVAWVLQRY